MEIESSKENKKRLRFFSQTNTYYKDRLIDELYQKTGEISVSGRSAVSFYAKSGNTFTFGDVDMVTKISFEPGILSSDDWIHKPFLELTELNLFCEEEQQLVFLSLFSKENNIKKLTLANLEHLYILDWLHGSHSKISDLTIYFKDSIRPRNDFLWELGAWKN